MTHAMQTTIRRLEPGDERIVEQLATRTPRTELLDDDRTIFVVAFDGDEPVGFVLSYELPRRHGDATILFVYEVDVDERHRRRGIASALLEATARIARERAIPLGFVLTNAANEPAMRLYEAAGGTRPHDDDVMWRFRYADA